jgi:hypothetical protein
MKLWQPLVTLAALLAAGVSFAQSMPSGSGAAPSTDTQYGTPSLSTPSMGERAVGGLSKCENLIGLERDQCLKNERAGAGGTDSRSAGAGSSQAQGKSTEPTAPGTVR